MMHTIITLVLFAGFVLPSNSFTAFRVAPCRSICGIYPLFGDGNPPPFANYYAAAPPPSPSPQWSPPQVQQQALPSPTYISATPAPAASTNSMIMADIQASQRTDLINLIQSKIPDLTHRPQLSNSNVQGYDAPGSSNIAWLADVQIPHVLSSLTVFHGPLTDVPHILDRVLTIVAEDNPQQWIQWSVDIRPRAYGAYETMDKATGAYPGPETLGRKAFEYSGARNTFFTKFGSLVQQWMESIVSQFDGAVPLPIMDNDNSSPHTILTTGPLAMHLQIPATAMNGQTLVRLRRELAQTWLRWSTEEQHDHRPGAPINAQYVYDSKYRQNAFLALRDVYAKVFPPDQALDLAIAESGPLDEAYVGGGS